MDSGCTAETEENENEPHEVFNDVYLIGVIFFLILLQILQYRMQINYC